HLEVADLEEAGEHVLVGLGGEEQFLVHVRPRTVTSTLFKCGSPPGSGGKSSGSGKSFICTTSRALSRRASWRKRRNWARVMPRWFVQASRRPPGASARSAPPASFR